MSRRAVPSCRAGDGGSIPSVGSFNQKSKTSPLLSIVFVLLGAFVIIAYFHSGSGGTDKESVSKMEGVSCTAEVQWAIPVLQKTYGDSMHKVLHVGPETCAVVSMLWKEEDTEAWGVEPYDLEDADSSCKSLVRKGIVRAADIKFPLPYRPKSFSLVIVSDALEYLSPKYLTKTLPELARVSADGVVIFTAISCRLKEHRFCEVDDISKATSDVDDQITKEFYEVLVGAFALCEGGHKMRDILPTITAIVSPIEGYPGQQRVKVSELPKFGRPAKFRSASWWVKYFFQTGLEESETAMKKFEQAASKMPYKSGCQIFHLSSNS